MRKKKKKSIIPFVIIFVIGLCILLYPVISRMLADWDASNYVQTFEQEKGKISTVEVQERLSLAHAYNEGLMERGEVLEDPYQKERQEKGRAEYARMLEIHEQIGHISIPRIQQDLPIFAGTEEVVLRKGVGHMQGTSLPIGGNNTHCVLTAHRGLPEAVLFSKLNEVVVGDKFYVTNLYETLAYEVDQIKTIEPSVFDDLIIKSGHDYVTLLTCTPYMVNSHRLLVRGHRIEYVPDQKLADETVYKNNHRYRWILYIFLILAGTAVFLYFIDFITGGSKRRRKKRMAKKAPAVKEKEE
ncbi:MAG: class C sortase [Eubacteriales bacterium]|nr:class C sortase [Eubacteriales bacterium]